MDNTQDIKIIYDAASYNILINYCIFTFACMQKKCHSSRQSQVKCRGV